MRLNFLPNFPAVDFPNVTVHFWFCFSYIYFGFRFLFHCACRLPVVGYCGSSVRLDGYICIFLCGVQINVRFIASTVRKMLLLGADRGL